MARRLLVGVDIGTSAVKAAIYRPDGAPVAEASKTLTIHHVAPGVVEQDQTSFIEAAARTVERALRESSTDAASVAAIGFSSQMAGIGSVDEDFHPATRYDSWLDMRCQPYIEALARDHAREITLECGCPPTCAHSAKMLWWKHERPEDYARIARFLTPSAYVAGYLAGLRGDDAFIDHTFLHFTGCSDARAGAWSDMLCERLGIDRDRLPRIVEPSSVVGETRGDRIRDFGLPAGVPVVAGCGDTAAAALGGGLVEPGMFLDVAGTASVFAGTSDRFVADAENLTLMTMRSIIPGLWHPLAFVAGGGMALDWFADLVTPPGGSPPDLDELVAEAMAVTPGADGLEFSPHLGGRIAPAGPGRRGHWSGFSWGHGRAAFFRSVLESIALEYADYVRILRELNPSQQKREARVVGGGARSAGWCQIKADVLDLPYRRLERADIGTLGVALVAGHAVGLVPDLAATARSASQASEQAIWPRADQVAAYREVIGRHMAFEKALDKG